MIIGSVNADYEPIIVLHICGADAKVHEQTAIVDTGFNGWLSLRFVMRKAPVIHAGDISE